MTASEALTDTVVPEDDSPHLLVVDDDDRIRQLLSRYLSANGYRVSVAGTAAAARQQLDSLVFDLLIVDVMMPGEDGISFTASLRERSDVAVLMLTARAEAEDRIKGLEVGADDYLTKPFEPRELLLRIKGILRRAAMPVDPVFEDVRFGSFVFHVPRQELKSGETAIRLTERERELLTLFANRPGETIPRHELASGESGDRTVDVQINRLRRKIERDPAEPAYLQTVRGVGYRLVTD